MNNHGSRLSSQDVPDWMQPFVTDPSWLHRPWPDSPFLEFHLERAPYDAEERELIRKFARDGFVIFDPEIERFDRLAAEIVEDLKPQYEDQTPRRVSEGWFHHEGVRALASAPKVLAFLRHLFQREPIPFQTINFDRGSEQPTHSDIVHFHAVPAHFMCGVWIALEDIDQGNGPLHYYPGSHRLPDYYMTDLKPMEGVDPYTQYEMFVASLMQAHQLQKQELVLKKGMAIIWAANLFHGGSPVREAGRTRHSQVTHYYFDDCFYYQPFDSEVASGDLCPREVINISSGEWVNPCHSRFGSESRLESKRWKYPRPLPAFVNPVQD